MSKKRYTITVVEQDTEITLTKKQWQKGGPIESNGEYGYTPQVEQHEVVDRQIYIQHLEELDLLSVIQAVNGLNHDP